MDKTANTAGGKEPNELSLRLQFEAILEEYKALVQEKN